MKRKYASTFISGLQEVVKDMLLQRFPGVEIVMLLDGLVVYQGDISPAVLQGARFLNNTFLILDMFNVTPDNPLQTMLTAVSRDRELANRVRASIASGETGRTFRLIASVENHLVPIPEDLRGVLERRIATAGRLSVNRAKPDLEFWFLYRREGLGFFMQRVTTHTAHERVLERGELRPELAYTLCFLSEPAAGDVFWDPFCGHGAIPLMRALSFPFNMVFASDRDQEQVQFVRRRLKKLKVRSLFIVKRQDALRTAFEDGFVDKIVTDPPWGLFETLDMAAGDFYSLMVSEFSRVLKANGILVVLTARTAEFEGALSSMGGTLRLLNRYNILVAGKKAAIFKVRKQQPTTP